MTFINLVRNFKLLLLLKIRKSGRDYDGLISKNDILNTYQQVLVLIFLELLG